MKIRIRHILSSLILFLAVVTASAAHITTEFAGQLGSRIADPENERDLTVSGPIDATDLMFIAEKMSALERLDLSGATIVASVAVVKGKKREYPGGFFPAGVFAGSKIRLIVFPVEGELSIGEMAFAGASISELQLGQNVRRVGLGAFSACNELKKLEYSGSSRFDTHVFADCRVLETVRLDDVDSIAGFTFSGCERLSEISGAKTLSVIGESAFSGCSSLESFEFGSSLRAIGENSFASTALLNLDLTECAGLTSLGDWAFACCHRLESLTLPSGLKTIGRGVFFDCSSLTSLPLPPAVASVEAYALKGLSAIEEIELPSDLEYIGDMAMSGMTGLATIYADGPADVPQLGDDVWDRLAKETIALYVSSQKAGYYESAPQWQDFNIVTASTSVPDFRTDVADTRMYATFEDSELLVRAEGVELDEVLIYDLSARKIFSRGGLNSSELKVDLRHISDRVLIVCASTADGYRTAVKIVRN